MQARFDFAISDLGRWRGMLAPLLADLRLRPPRRPMSELIKAMISGRTLDADSQAAYDAIVCRFVSIRQLARAAPDEIEAVIARVNYAPIKAEWMARTLRIIGRDRPDYRLEFLGGVPFAEALVYLEQLPGVRRKVAASVLNASTLRRSVFIVDTHVRRVLRRLRYVRRNADYCEASEAVTADLRDWSGEDLLLLHIAMKRLGQRHCHEHAPDCRACPLRRECPGA